MDVPTVISHLHANHAVFGALLRNTPATLQLWRPHPDHWCLLEIVCHLYDAERDDFRARLRTVLDDPSQALPKTDPASWVTSLAYLEQDFAARLDDFLREREASVQWLEGLTDPAWEHAYQHPTVGPLTARMFLTSWLAHDYLHLRQIIRLKYLCLEATSGVRIDCVARRQRPSGSPILLHLPHETPATT